MAGLPGLPPPGFSAAQAAPAATAAPVGLPGLPAPGFSTAVYSGPTLSTDPIGALTSMDWWTSRPAERTILTDISDGVQAAPGALLDTVKAIPQGAENVYESIRHPIQSIQDGTTERTLRGVGTTALGLAGSVLGAPGGAAGVSAGGAAGVNLFNKLLQVLGVDEPTTPQEDLSAFGRNTGTGLGATAIAKVVGAGANKAGDVLERYSNKVQQEALGANANSFAASARRDGVIRFEEVKNADGTITKVPLDAPTTSLHKALEGVKNEGLITPTTTAADLSMGIAGRLDELGHEVGSIIAQVDELRAQKGVPIYPQLKAAKEYVETKAPLIDRPALRKELAKWNEGFRNEGDGSLGLIQQQKIVLGNRTYGPGKEAAEAFDKAVTYDLKRTIEDVTNSALGKEQAGTVAALNNRMSNLFEVQRIPDLAAIRDANKSTTSALHNLSATTGGAVGSGLLGTAAIGGLPGAGIGLTAGLAARYLQTPGGKVLQSRIGNPLASALKAGAALEAPAASLAIANQQAEPKATAREKKKLAAQLKKILPSSQAAPTSPGQKNQTSDSAIPSPNLRPISQTTQVRPNDLISTVLSPSSKGTAGLMKAVLGGKMDAKQIEVVQQIDADPVDSAIFEMESSRGKKLKNPDSSASGPFQLIAKTAKTLGADATDVDWSDDYAAYKKLRAENEKRFGSDPVKLYGAHYLGATTLAKWLEGKSLSPEQERHVRDFKTVALPRFMKIYQRILAAKSGTVEA